MAFPNKDDDVQRQMMRDLWCSHEHKGGRPSDAATVQELCEIIVAEMRTNYRRNQRPSDVAIWLSTPALWRLAEQYSQRQYESLIVSLKREMRQTLQSMVNESKLGKVAVSIYPHGNLWGVIVDFLPTNP